VSAGKGWRHFRPGGEEPVWSPDRKRVAYSDGDDLAGIWVMDADGTNRRWLTRGGGSPQWSPDGRHITYLDLRRDEYVSDIWTVDTERGGPPPAGRQRWLSGLVARRTADRLLQGSRERA
jgi:Tol biopolymer transport system component